jgi:glycosyltransferase involved in cell wall biosynthesis
MHALPQPHRPGVATEAGTSDPRAVSRRQILTNSTMLQAEAWSKAIYNVLTDDEICHRQPAPAEWNIAWRLFRRRREADVVLAQGPAAFFYGLLDRLMPWNRRPWMAREVFIPEPNPASFSWRLKRAARRFAFRRMAAMDVAARDERRTCADYFALPEDRFQFVPFHTNVCQPCYCPESLYGLAAGRSGRDYKTFFQAVRDLDYRFVVVAPRADIVACEVPGNVELHCDISREQYLSLLHRAAFVVVPLHTLVRSTGQVVVLEAYAYGKPVVATRTLGVVDYVRDSETGLLCAAYDPQGMRQAIQMMIEMPEKRTTWGRAALEWVRQDFTFEAYAQRLFEFTGGG